jgi:hypothetical protein
MVNWKIDIVSSTGTQPDDCNACKGLNEEPRNGDGKSHWLEGVLLMMMYLIIALAAWYVVAMGAWQVNWKIDIVSSTGTQPDDCNACKGLNEEPRNAISIIILTGVL